MSGHDRKLLEAVLEQMPSAVAIVEAPTGRLLMANPKFAAIFRQPNVPLAGVSDYARFIGFHPDGRQIAPEEWPLSRSLATGEVIEGEEIHIQRGDGSHGTIRVNSAPIKDGDAVVAGVVVADDVSDEATLRRDNAQLYDAAQRAIRYRDEFLSVATHELKTPLTSLQLHLTGLLRAVELGKLLTEKEAVQDRLLRAEAQVTRIAALLDELLDVSRISGGRLTITRETMDLAQLAREVAGRFDAQLERAGSTLALDAAAPLAGSWDRARLDQVLSNLLGNAIKYGRGKPIALSVSAIPDGARLTVRDEGIGIPEAEQARVFERFERASTVRNYGGMGLGLWIVREIVDAHGGHIMLESAPEAGATFLVDLPLA
jgi:signal transduction histidine kinase